MSLAPDHKVAANSGPPPAPGVALRCLIVSGFGSGYSPVASGTAGSAVAILIASIAWAIVSYSGWSLRALDVVWIVLALIAGVACVALGKWASEYYAGRCRKEGDPGQVVLDEFAGQWIALLAIPMVGLHQAIVVLAVQFFLFRVFDVLKVPPGRQLEHLPFGWGILLDDVAAGVYANLVGQIVFRALWPH
jgi:phosphatidylglycerophosphatase A